MANPFLSMLGLGNQPAAPSSQQVAQQPVNNGIMSNLNTVMGLYNLVRNSNNQAETLNQMAQTNPNVANTINYIKENGGDLNKIANDLANRSGVSLPLLMGLFK